MKFTYCWLKEFIDLPDRLAGAGEQGPQAVAHFLTMAGLEVDSLKPLDMGSGLVVALVKGIRPHPRSDHLSLCDVDVKGEQLQVVCGAPNVRGGIKAPLARAGASLPSGAEIKAINVRGEPSQGMLCSEKELGLSDDHDGVMILPDQAPVGDRLFSYLGLEDWVYEISVTPNRGDCLGIRGIARELAALTGGKLRLPPVAPRGKGPSPNRRMQVQIENPELCPRYSARAVIDLRAEPSPPWLRFRLESCGVRSINAIVDVTNYAMLETGQPLHAFDLDRLKSGRIVIRPARRPLSFVSLDKIERALIPEDLLICDGDLPIALAGIIGGLDSEVSSETRAVLLESAHFNPLAIRRTAKRLGLHSEASHRFERWVDPEGTVAALDRAVYLLKTLSGGTALKETIDRYPRRFKPQAIALTDDTTSRYLGIELPRKSVERALTSIGVKIQSRTKQRVTAVPPSHRADLTREADLIEELARLYGYDKITPTLPRARLQGGMADPFLRWSRRLRVFLAGEGLAEAVNIPFTSVAMNHCFPGTWAGEWIPVTIRNPIKQENAELRLSLLPGLIGNLRLHLDQRAQSFWVFEMGKVFRNIPQGSHEEKTNVAALLFGERDRLGLRAAPPSFSFLDLKGLLENIIEIAGTGPAIWEHRNLPRFLHPGVSATFQINERQFGYLGELHPDLCSSLSLPPLLVFELDFDRLVQYARFDLAVHALPRFPPVERDLAVVVDEGFPAQQIIDWIKGLGNSLIEAVQIFDHYSGSPIPQGKKSLAYSVSYRAQDRTLTDEEVNKIHEDLTARLCQQFGVALRG